MTTLTAPRPAQLKAQKITTVEETYLARACEEMGMPHEEIFGGNKNGSLPPRCAPLRWQAFGRCVAYAQDDGVELSIRALARAANMDHSGVARSIRTGKTTKPYNLVLTTTEAVAYATCNELTVNFAELGDGRRRYLAKIMAKKIIAKLAHEYTSDSYPVIGTKIGTKTYSTLIEGHHDLDENILTDPNHRQRIVRGCDVVDIIDRVKGRLGITSDPT